MTETFYERPYLPTTTVVPWPEDRVTFVQYLNRLYEDIATAVNERDFVYFTIPITGTATEIPNLPRDGAYMICISGEEPYINPTTGATEYLPTGTWAVAKSSPLAAGAINALQLQAGVGVAGSWNGVNLAITSSATNFLVAHSGTVTGNFNIKYIGTQ